MTNPLKTSAIDTFPKPKTTKKVKSFLGMASYYQKFVKDYVHIVSPLTTLFKKDVKFKWTPQCDKAFQTLKDELTSASILASHNLLDPSYWQLTHQNMIWAMY